MYKVHKKQGLFVACMAVECVIKYPKRGSKMKNFPVFATEFGVASLVLKEIPYRQTAYVTIQDSLEPEKLLEECVDFCRACGAEEVFAKGSHCLEKFPIHTVIYEMRGQARVEEGKVESLWPVTAENVSKWRQICNERMRHVDCSATQEKKDEKEILASGGAYFIHDHGKLLGIGWLREGELLLVASTVPGAGERVMHTLMSLVPGQQLKLEVASTNARAIRLYEKLGFVKGREVSWWYQVRSCNEK